MQNKRPHRLFSVVVSRINEGPRDEPEVTIQARALRLTPEGDLYIEEDDVRNRMFGATTWDSLTLTRIR